MSDALISLRDIPELKNIAVNGNIRIGAGCTISELIENAQLQNLVPALIQAAENGSVQIRNVATVGGNIGNCSPCADTAPALLVLGAKAVVQSPQAYKADTIRKLFCGPGKLLTAKEIVVELLIDIPNPRQKPLL